MVACISILALCKHFWRGTWRCWHAWTSWRGRRGGEVLLGSNSELLFARSQLPRRWLPLPRLAPDSGRTSSTLRRHRRPRLPCKRQQLQTRRQKLLVSEGDARRWRGRGAGGITSRGPAAPSVSESVLKPARAHLPHGKQISQARTNRRLIRTSGGWKPGPDTQQATTRETIIRSRARDAPE